MFSPNYIFEGEKSVLFLDLTLRQKTEVAERNSQSHRLGTGAGIEYFSRISCADI